MDKVQFTRYPWGTHLDVVLEREREHISFDSDDSEDASSGPRTLIVETFFLSRRTDVHYDFTQDRLFRITVRLQDMRSMWHEVTDFMKLRDLVSAKYGVAPIDSSVWHSPYRRCAEDDLHSLANAIVEFDVFLSATWLHEDTRIVLSVGREHPIFSPIMRRLPAEGLRLRYMQRDEEPTRMAERWSDLSSI